MKHHFSVIVLFFLLLAGLPGASAQDDSAPQPPITPENAGQLVELAQTDLSAYEQGLQYAKPPRLALHNTHLATAFAGQVRVYTLPGLALQHELGEGCGVEFSPDGQFLLYGGCASNLIIWNLEAQSAQLDIAEQVSAWRFSPDAARLIVQTSEAVHVYDATTWTEIGALPNLDTGNGLTTIAPNGDWLVQVDDVNQVIHWWTLGAETSVDTATNGQVNIPLPAYLSNQVLVVMMQFEVDGTYPGAYRLWDATTHEELATLLPPEGYQWASTRRMDPIISFFADDQRFVTMAGRRAYDEALETDSYAYIIQVWDVADLTEPVITLSDADSAAFYLDTMEISANEQWLLVNNIEQQTKLTLWDINTQMKAGSLGSFDRLMYSPPTVDHTLLAFTLEKAGDNNLFQQAAGLWDISTASLLQMVWHDARVTYTRLTPDASLLLTITEDGLGHVWGVGENDSQPVTPELTENRAEYEGVSIDLGPFPGGTLSGEFVEAVDRQENEGFWLVAPGHIRLSVTQPDHFSCGIEVFSAADYATMYPGVLESFAEGLAAEPPEYHADGDLWPINARRMIHGKSQYLPLPDGQGWRYLTDFSQGADPIWGGVLYEAVGLLNKGEYYVRARCGTGVWFLPATGDAAKMDLGLFVDDRIHPQWEAFFSTYNDYLAAINQQIANSADSGFQPSLDQLDALIASIQITDAPLGGDVPG